MIKIEESWKQENGKYECPYCKKQYTKKGIATHIWRTHGAGQKEWKSWNKGLTKHDDERVLKNAINSGNATRERIKNGWKPYGEYDRRSVWTKERREALSKKKKKFYEENPESHPNRKLAGNRNKMTYPEQVANDWFKQNNIEAIHNECIEGFYPDFKVENILIEIDGERWHQNKKKDAERDKILKNAGYTVIRISAKEMIEQRLKTIFAHRVVDQRQIA